MIGAARQPTEQGQIKNLRKIFRLQTDALAIAIDQQRRAFQRTVIETQRTLQIFEIGRAHVCTPVTKAHIVCRPQLEKKHLTPRPNNSLLYRDRYNKSPSTNPYLSSTIHAASL